MSVCEHDPHCPGHGPAHDHAVAMAPPTPKQVAGDPIPYLIRRPVKPHTFGGRRGSSLGPLTEVNLEKDRSLSGKARRRARRAARR